MYTTYRRFMCEWILPGHSYSSTCCVFDVCTKLLCTIVHCLHSLMAICRLFSVRQVYSATARYRPDYTVLAYRMLSYMYSLVEPNKPIQQYGILYRLENRDKGYMTYHPARNMTQLFYRGLDQQLSPTVQQLESFTSVSVLYSVSPWVKLDPPRVNSNLFLSLKWKIR